MQLLLYSNLHMSRNRESVEEGTTTTAGVASAAHADVQRDVQSQHSSGPPRPPLNDRMSA